MGWTKVCGTAQSGIWVLKGNARTRMLPANLDHLRVGWISRGSHEAAWVTPWHDCLCSYAYVHGAAVRPHWHGVIGLWGRVAPLVTLVCQEGGANGSELEPVTPVQVHVSVGIATTSPCSAHRMRLSS